MPESARENVIHKVNSVIAEGLKLEGIKVVEAERRESRGSRFPGVIIAKCRSTEHKQKILSHKKKLKDSRRFANVYIMSDKPLQQRIFESNMRVLVDTVGNGRLQLTGGRLHRQRRHYDNRDGAERRPFVNRDGEERRVYDNRDGEERRLHDHRDCDERRSYDNRDGEERRSHDYRDAEERRSGDHGHSSNSNARGNVYQHRSREHREARSSAGDRAERRSPNGVEGRYTSPNRSPTRHQ